MGRRPARATASIATAATSSRRSCPAADRLAAHEVAERIRRAVVERLGRRPAVRASRSAPASPASRTTAGPRTSSSRSPTGRCTWSSPRAAPRLGPEPLADPYLRALDETALRLLDRHDQDEPARDDRGPGDGAPRHAARLRLSRGPRGAEPRAPRRDRAVSPTSWGSRMPTGPVSRAGSSRPVSRWPSPTTTRGPAACPSCRRDVRVGRRRAADVGGRVVGVLGLVVGRRPGRRWGKREIDALTSFAQLASIALDNARLVDAAQRGALYDPTTGLPNRELLTDRIGHALARPTRRRGRGRGHPARPRPVQGHQRERRPRRRRPAARGVGQRLVELACGPATRSPGSVATSSGSSSTRSPDADEAQRHRRADRRRAAAPFPMGGREWFISASLGISIGRPGRATPDELLREAEIAMVRSKADPIAPPRALRTVHVGRDASTGSTSRTTSAGPSSAASCASTTSRSST